MIDNKNKLHFYIAADRIMSGVPAKTTLKEIVFSFIFARYNNLILKYLKSVRYVAYYENTKKKKFSLLYIYHKLRFSSLGFKLGFSIGCNSFGYGLLIPHYGTIVINSSTIAGNFCVLHTSTCIAGDQKHIGDGLYLSTGSIISGKNITIGTNVSIAANSLVNKPIDKNNVLVAGSPAKIIKDSAPWYERDGVKFSERIKEVEKLSKIKSE